jgi:hypothetical protein
VQWKGKHALYCGSILAKFLPNRHLECHKKPLIGPCEGLNGLPTLGLGHC